MQHTPVLEPHARAMTGMVIRDPWYDYGTMPGYPNVPNIVAQERMGAMLAAMGVRWVRLAFHIEGSDAYSITQVARNDYFINHIAPRYNLNVLGLLSYGLMRDQHPGVLATPNMGYDPVYGDNINPNMRTWLDRARMITNRYQGRIAAYELFNEQNRITDTEALSPTVTAHLHTTLYHFFHHVDGAQPGDQSWREHVPIVVGGLHPYGPMPPGDTYSFTDVRYLRQMYASDAFQDYRQRYGHFPVDGVGYHPYPKEIFVGPDDDIERMLTRLDTIRATLAEVGDPDVPFWITEIGYNAAYGEQTEQGQADFLQAVFTHLTDREDVATVFWFKYEDFPPAEGPNAHQWGVVQIPFVEQPCPGQACYDAAGRPSKVRPSFWTYRQLTGGQ